MSALDGTCKETKCDSLNRSSMSFIVSKPESFMRARRSADESHAITRMPNASATFATLEPILPNPTMPITARES